ncbi:MAG: hypothetical protein ACXVHX_02125 [Solirubrobacteraceae bacterium]
MIVYAANFSLREIPAVAQWLTLKLTRRAVASLPERLRETKREEWAAELEAMHGSRVAVVILAWSFVRAARKIAAGEGVTGKSAVRRPANVPFSFEFDGVAVLFFPAHAKPAGDGQIVVTYMATYRRGYSTTNTIVVPRGTNAEDVARAIARRFGA